MPIPKVIHFLWLSEEKTPEVESCIETWKFHCEGYEIKEWNSKNFPYNDFIWTREAYLKKKWAFVTDFFRLWVLYNYGGIYLDADVTATGTFDKFLDHGLFMSTEFCDQLGVHAIGSIKGHPFIKKCLDYYSDRPFIKPDGSNDMKPIMPNIVTRIFMEHYNYQKELVSFDNNPRVFDDFYVYPDSFFTINAYDGCNVCIHNMYGAWRDDRSTNPSMVGTLENYYLNRFYCYSFNHKGWFHKFIMDILPFGVIRLYKKRRLKIKNNKRVQSVRI